MIHGSASREGSWFLEQIMFFFSEVLNLMIKYKQSLQDNKLHRIKHLVCSCSNVLETQSGHYFILGFFLNQKLVKKKKNWNLLVIFNCYTVLPFLCTSEFTYRLIYQIRQYVSPSHIPPGFSGWGMKLRTIYAF